jgi:DNA replication protein DnaC
MNQLGDSNCEQCAGEGVTYYRVRYKYERGATGERVKVELEREAIPPGTPPMDYYPPGYTYPKWTIECGECPCRTMIRQKDQLIKSTNKDGVPTKYDKYFWSDFDDQPKARAAAMEFVRGNMSLDLEGVTRNGLLFSGPTGVHKSSLTYMIYRELLSQGITAAWWLAAKLIEAEQDTYDNDFSGDRDAFVKACRTPLLILDDLGDKRPSGAVLEISPNRQEIMFKLFEHREAKGLPTIATTNLKKSELYDHFGDRVTSRILGLCHVIPMIGKDSRVNPAEAE